MGQSISVKGEERRETGKETLRWCFSLIACEIDKVSLTMCTRVFILIQSHLRQYKVIRVAFAPFLSASHTHARTV